MKVDGSYIELGVVIAGLVVQAIGVWIYTRQNTEAIGKHADDIDSLREWRAEMKTKVEDIQRRLADVEHDH